MTSFIVIVLFAASAPIAAARWLRVAQREHYLAGEVSKFASRWWRVGSRNKALFAVAVAAMIGSAFIALLAVISIEAMAIGPLGLSMRGRTSPLVWTRRLKTVAVVSASLMAAVIGASVAFDQTAFGVAACVVGIPLLVDLALLLLGPLEKRAAQKFVTSARERLDRVAPIRVAITGSYGKTTIKGYVRHLVGSNRSLVASPASFNNTGGLSRTVNEMLTQDTEVFVAEMGAYGPGEIRELCAWVMPDVAVLCNIGPVHLERFGSLENVVASKSEIFEGAATAIVNVDAYGLAEVAGNLRASGKRVITCSADLESAADLTVVSEGDGVTISHNGGSHTVNPPAQTANINLACALAVTVALDIPLESVTAHVATLTGPDHRCQVSQSPAGVTVVDDTYNSNPAGAAAALETLASIDAARRVIVTPGMVELGPEQAAANKAFAAAAAQIGDDVIIVGETNRAALDSGATSGTAAIHHVGVLPHAVEWVRSNLRAGDAVLYENDLPDHYP